MGAVWEFAWGTAARVRKRACLASVGGSAAATERGARAVDGGCCGSGSGTLAESGCEWRRDRLRGRNAIVIACPAGFERRCECRGERLRGRNAIIISRPTGFRGGCRQLGDIFERKERNCPRVSSGFRERFSVTGRQTPQGTYNARPSPLSERQHGSGLPSRFTKTRFNRARFRTKRFNGRRRFRKPESRAVNPPLMLRFAEAVDQTQHKKRETPPQDPRFGRGPALQPIMPQQLLPQRWCSDRLHHLPEPARQLRRETY